ncbi:MAG TPA: hypothetical protein VN026_14885 [Bacteroidia bacterium]|jgi:hypothetical protein|nr:hypothetical protein [Bacteroidia bacterium]
MALLAETIVEEWLMRNGYFTIRGLKLGVHEMDILAVKNMNGQWKNIHIEVQASHNPIGYITGNSSAKTRKLAELNKAVDEWVQKKFYLPKKVAIRKQLCENIKWELMLVHGTVKTQDELKLIEKRGIIVKAISIIIRELLEGEFTYTTAAAGDMVELIRIPQLSLDNLERDIKRKMLDPFKVNGI